MTDLGTVVGMLAGFCTTASFVPQVLRIIKTRHTKDLSLVMYALFVAGIVLWFVYGLLIGSWPVIFYNAVSFVLAGTVLLLKLRLG